MNPKKVKEATRMAREAEKQRRSQMERAQPEQSRAVVQNRNQLIMESQTTEPPESKGLQAQPLLGHIQDALHFVGTEHEQQNGGGPIRDRPPRSLGPYERVAKPRKREFDDDHSMSSADVRSSDPGHFLQPRPSRSQEGPRVSLYLHTILPGFD